MKFTSAALGMILAGVSYIFFTGFDVSTKYVARHYSVLEIMAVEFTAATLLLLLWAWIEQRKSFFREIHFKRKDLHAARGFLNAASNIMFFFGFTHMQLAEYYVILFLIPIWVAILAAIFLKEKATAALIISILVSFIGVVIALRPAGGISPWAVLVLGGTFSNALALIVLRRMTTSETQMSIAVSVCFCMAISNILPTVFIFVTPDLASFGFMVLGGVCFAVAQRLLIKGCQLAPASLAGAAQFLQLIYGAIAGYLVFGDVPSIWIYVGGVIVVAANLYLLFMQNRKATTALKLS